MAPLYILAVMRSELQVIKDFIRTKDRQRRQDIAKANPGAMGFLDHISRIRGRMSDLHVARYVDLLYAVEKHVKSGSPDPDLFLISTVYKLSLEN
jgi:DNA polymerase III delta subunit